MPQSNFAILLKMTTVHDMTTTSPIGTRYVVGCMTGTSLDGIDGALTKITGIGLSLNAEFVGLVSKPFDNNLRDTLLALTKNEPAKPIDFMQAARTLGQFHADTIAALLNQYLPENQAPAFAVAHGQTIWHAPTQTKNAPSLSWQLFDPWPIVHQLKIPVCYDLRQADLIAGGQGAPITPLADYILFQERANLIINLGGICNVTAWDNSTTASNINAIQGQDIYPCNLITDGLTQRLFPPAKYDQDAHLASSIAQVPDPCIEMISQRINTAIDCHHSLGREQLNDHWLNQLIDDFSSNFASQFPATGDLSIKHAILAASNHAIANQICIRTQTYNPTHILLAGGGAKNPLVTKLLTKAWLDSGAETVQTTDAAGIPCEAREAVAFAILGALSQDSIPITLPQITHADNPSRAGTWVYP
jgi:anhydro-N-acetylmuramic acid kinase